MSAWKYGSEDLVSDANFLEPYGDRFHARLLFLATR
jgi:hypothetical protein